MIFCQKLFKRLQSPWNMLSEKGQKQDKFVIYLLLIEVFVIILILGIKAANLAVALGTISMALAIVYIEIIKPWLQKPKIKIEFDNKRPFCLPVKTVPGNYLHYHIRLKVTNECELMAKRVRGKLIEIIDEEKRKPVEQFDPVFLHWSSVEFVRNVKPDYINPINLSYKEYDYLEIIFTEQEKTGQVTICTTTFPRGCIKEFNMNQPDFNILKKIAQINCPIFKIVISGQNIEPATEKYKLVWNGEKYDEIKMESYKENSKTIEKDKYKCAK